MLSEKDPQNLFWPKDGESCEPQAIAGSIAFAPIPSFDAKQSSLDLPIKIFTVSANLAELVGPTHAKIVEEVQLCVTQRCWPFLILTVSILLLMPALVSHNAGRELARKEVETSILVPWYVSST